jgi:hypothetical protein
LKKSTKAHGSALPPDFIDHFDRSQFQAPRYPLGMPYIETGETAMGWLDEIDDPVEDEMALSEMADRMMITETVAVTALACMLNLPEAESSVNILGIVRQAVQNRSDRLILSEDMASAAQRQVDDLLGKAMEALYPRLH